MHSIIDLKFLSLAIIYVCSLAGNCLADKPNIVIFFIDDLGYKDLGCYGSEFYETPQIDELAKRSVRFTQFYSAHPVCSPTRAALMSGKAPQRMGITQWIPQPSEVHLPVDEITLGEAFQDAGYETGYIGKWHLGAQDENMPGENGFDWLKGVNRAGSPGSYFHPFTRKKKGGIGYWDVPDMDGSRTGDYLTDRLTDHAIDFVTAKRDKPFLLCFAHYAVHTPIESPQRLVDKYAAKKSQQFGESAKGELAIERNNSRTRTRQDGAAYAGMMENLDTNVGRLLAKLKESGLEENTIVIFTSDNGGLTTLRQRGGPTSVKPLRAGKGWCYEGGIRIPTLISWPGTIASGETDLPGITMDFYPTLLELAGIDMIPDQHLDGVSLAPILKGEARDQAEPRLLGWHYPHNHGSGHTPSTAIREGPWKLIWLSDKNKYELYNITNDLSESKNLADQEPDQVQEMAEKMKQWIEQTTFADVEK